MSVVDTIFDDPDAPARWPDRVGTNSVRRVTNPQRKRMREARARGLSCQAIVDELGLPFCARAIWWHVRDVASPARAGVPRRIDRDQLLRLRERHGLSYEALAERFGSTPGSMRVIAYRARRERRDAA